MTWNPWKLRRLLREEKAVSGGGWAAAAGAALYMDEAHHLIAELLTDRTLEREAAAEKAGHDWNLGAVARFHLESVEKLAQLARARGSALDESRDAEHDLVRERDEHAAAARELRARVVELEGAVTRHLKDECRRRDRRSALRRFFRKHHMNADGTCAECGVGPGIEHDTGCLARSCVDQLHEMDDPGKGPPDGETRLLEWFALLLPPSWDGESVQEALKAYVFALRALLAELEVPALGDPAHERRGAAWGLLAVRSRDDWVSRRTALLRGTGVLPGELEAAGEG